MTRRVAVVLVLLLLGGSLTSNAGADAKKKSEAARIGTWGHPIAEIPLFAKRPPKDSKESVKIPPAVSMVMLPDGRVVYWGGLENLEDGKYPLASDAPNQVRSSRTRILDLRGKSPTWTVPDPEDSGRNRWEHGRIG